MRRCAAITDRNYEDGGRPFELKLIPLIIGTLTLVLAIWAFYHYRHVIEHVSLIIQSLGVDGIIVSVIIMAVLCVLPVPSEFFIVIDMEVYGVAWGLFYSWIGAIVGAVAAMYLTRWLGQPLVRRMLSAQRQQQVDQWVSKRGTLGLFALRFVPFVPFHALNYVAGLLNVTLWPFIWTTAVGLIPFELFMGGIFLGISHGIASALIVGVFVLLALGAVTYFFRKKWLAAFSVNSDGQEKPHVFRKD